MASIIDSDQYRDEKVTFTPPKKKDKRISMFMQYDGGMSYHRVTGRNIFGINRFVDEQTGSAGDYKMNVSLAGSEDYAEELMKTKERFVDYVQENSEMLLKKKYGPDKRETVAAFTSDFVKKGVSKDGTEYAPRLEMKVRANKDNDDIPDVKVLYSKSEEVPLNSFEDLIAAVPKGCMVTVVFTIRPWVISGRFGLSLSLLYIKPEKVASAKLDAYPFADDDESAEKVAKIAAASASDEKEDSEEDEAKEESDAEPEAAVDSDAEAKEESEAEEAKEESEEEEEPEPVKKPAKKSTAKTTKISKKK